MNTVPRVFAYLRRYPWMALGRLGCAIVSTLMLVVFPAVTKRVIDEVLIGASYSAIDAVDRCGGVRVLLESAQETCSITFFSCATMPEFHSGRKSSGPTRPEPKGTT